MACIRTSVLVATLALSAGLAQAADPECLLAGRLDGQGRWAPQLPGLQLLDAQGRGLAAGEPLGAVRQVRLERPVALARCDRDRPLARGDGATPTGGPVPAATAGVLDVEAVHQPPLRVGGTLVELQVRVPDNRRTLLSR